MTKIEARKKWNKTPYQLSKGKRYCFFATGEWIDWYIPTDAKGFERKWLKPFELLKRFPNGKWSSLELEAELKWIEENNPDWETIDKRIEKLIRIERQLFRRES